MKLAELFLKCLKSEGVEYIFGVPDEENIEIYSEASLESPITFTTRHAAFMARSRRRSSRSSFTAGEAAMIIHLRELARV
jgi:thiamine pyrophosphate-dependent acetolactate synthase large subunit-like protein